MEYAIAVLLVSGGIFWIQVFVWLIKYTIRKALDEESV